MTTMDYKDKIDLKKDSKLVCLVNHGQFGLQNIGNTCFMNTALQCLSAIDCLSAYFLSDQYLSDINKKLQAEFVRAYVRFLKSAWEDNDCIVTPKLLKQTLGKFYDPYSGFRQNDAAECFNKIIELLHDGLSYAVSIAIASKKGQPLTEASKMEQLSIECTKMHFEKNYSIPVKLFYGQFQNRVICVECKKISMYYEPFSMINLPICEKTNTLFDCIDAYTSFEIMDGVNKYSCGNCKKETIGKKKIMVWKLPNILVFSFNRFAGSRKIEKYIDFPINKVIFNNLVQNENAKNVVYDLVAVANHSGGLSGGHYWAYTKGTNGKWFDCNDEHNSEITNEGTIVSNSAYFLVYKKRSISAEIVLSS
jgi:ubiquitin carboxyl-terminal hydrolase 8